MRRNTLLALLLIVGVCGCSSLSEGLSTHFGKKKWVVADANNPVVEVACVWQPGEGRGEFGVPARGFSGQILFFTQKDAEPALVNGSIRVYLFADRGTPEERAKPIKQYDYTPQEWTAHATMTSLGPGYSIFVPYPDPEAYQVRCQLRVRFIPADGEVVWSEALTMILEGPPRPGGEPNSWATDDAKSLVGQKNQLEITRRSGTPAQLKKAAEQDEPRKTLRTDTFTLSEIQRVAYEAPARRVTVENAVETDALPIDEMPSESDPQEPLSHKTRVAEVADHPLASTRHSRVGLRSPETAVKHSVRPVPSRHPLTRENSATMSDSPRFLLSHPLSAPPSTSEHPTEASTSAPVNGASTAGDVTRLLPHASDLQSDTARNRAGLTDNTRQVEYPDATPLYGAWQRMPSGVR